MKGVIGWLGRTGLIYLLLCAAIAFFVFGWPALTGQFSGEDLRRDAMSVAEVRAQLSEERDAAQATLESRVSRLDGAGRAAIEQRLEAAREERIALAPQLAEEPGWLDSVRPSRILERKRVELRVAALDAEIAALQSAREGTLARTALARAEERLQRYERIPTENAVAVSRELCFSAREALTEFDRQEPIERGLREIVLRERQRLEERRDTRCEAADARADRRELGLAARRALEAERERVAALEEVRTQVLPDPAAGLSDTTLRDIAWRAFLALLAVLLLPFAIRTLFYYALAPLVARGPPICLAGPSGLARSPRAETGSSPTLAVTLNEGEELLVRQSYLQSSPAGAEMRTQWLLSWRNILTSLASGMAFLTRGRNEVRGTGVRFGISARDDPFAEIARIDLTSGEALVLQPRALAAIVQPVGKPMQIRSRWRLFSLHAWLTFQLRFLVFHGPGALIVKGGRGVRVERAEAGRRFGQDQLVGFSAHTAYTVTRSETFLPYFFGREPLFLDRVADTDAREPGILVIEEAPLAGRRKGVRGGLEGAFDALLKAFGI